MKAVEAFHPLMQLPRWVKIVLAAGALVAFFAALVMLPLPIPPYLDFQVLYQTNMGLLQGVSPYDHTGQVDLIARLAHVAPEQVRVLPFPYPPWYALSTLWLARLPIAPAVRVWFGVNLALLLLSAWLLTDGWSPLKRLSALGLAIFFLPVLGSLAVGQYGFLVLLGAGLTIYAIRHEKAALLAVAAALLTFKPHLGAFVIIVALFYLWQRRDGFARKALLYCIAAGAALFCLGFLADRAWPLSYIRSLLAFRQDSDVAACGLCSSLPAMIAGQIPGAAGLSLALGIGILILIGLTALLLLKGRPIMQQPAELVAWSILIVLLASPYLLNYDFLLLLVPFAVLAGEERAPVDWILLAGVYLAPFLALLAWGRQGNFILPLGAAILLVLLHRGRPPLDVSLPAAYNH